MRRSWLALAIMCGMMVTACDEKSPTTPTPPSINTQITLAPGQVTVLQPGSLNITFTQVVKDSRCPGDANCISAGEAVVALNVRPDSLATKNVVVTTGPTGSVAAVDGYSIELLELMPYPFASMPHKPEDYRAKLRISAP